ncbi:leukocyte cell-derived chemotaxin 1 [Dunckerocampus dactyliophorus]|uniref:leukocyte cell-derived chemotaxin 1 n=1 Tax=Dunckerocampus dactyliophorus TaxID=161453 RepID=UPI0024071472|nr:leukocyte cell-derived chemotaxin 1 [Dunckerocampus dactyliophorus]
MKETMEEHPKTHQSGCFETLTPWVQNPSGAGRLLRYGAVVLIVGAVLMICASMAALLLRKESERNVYSVHYSMNINGEAREGSVEIDSDDNVERFKTRSGDEEAVEIRDFQSGITAIRFFGGDKCYIKSQIKGNLPRMGAHNKESLMSDLADEDMPVRFDDEFLIWVSSEQPLKDTAFLSRKILALCEELPIYWLQPLIPKDGERRKRRRRRNAQRAKRQSHVEVLEVAGKEGFSRLEDGREEGPQSDVGSGFNPENPYHRSGDAGEGNAVTFDSMLDHQGICCSECQRGYTHCQRICEPLRGHWPWPYNYRGCQVACRVIMPCRWWVARILGIV